MILAAGFGTRMGALTQSRPKPLLTVAGRTLLDHTLDHVAGAGVGHVVVNLHYFGDQIKKHMAQRNDLKVDFSEELPEILDTGGGVVQALPMLGTKPFLTLNSDAIFSGPNPVEALVDAWDPERFDAVLLLVRVEDTLAYHRAGDFFVDETSRTPHRRGDANSAPYVYAGAQLIHPRAYADTPEGAFSNNVIWDRLLASGRLGAQIYPGHWVDVGTPEGLEAAEGLLQGS